MRGRYDRGSRSGKAEDVLGNKADKKYKECERGEKTHEHYREALFGRKQFMHKMKILRSGGHETYGMCMNKISISPFDTKCWIADDGVQMLAYGHKDIRRAEAVY